jgi:hypothetical protein
MSNLKRFLRIGPFAVLSIAIALGGAVNLAKAQDRSHGSVVAFGITGRVFLNPGNGTGQVAAYLTNLEGFDGALFNGTPGEATAYFTAVSAISLQPLPPNGDLALAIVPAGTLNIYVSSQPAHDWNNPASFTQGQLVATFTRKAGLVSQWGTTANHTYSGDLIFSQSFTMNGKSFNFRDIAPRGVTCSENGPNAPLPGATPSLVVLVTAGTCVSTGLN